MKSNGFAVSASDSPRRSNNQVGWWDRVTFLLARSLLLFGLVYASWRFGAVQTAPLRDLALLLVMATASLLCSPKIWSSRSRFSAMLPALLLGFIAYAWVQTAALPERGNWLGFSQTKYAEPSLRLASAGVERLRGEGVPAAARYGSVAPEETRQAIVPYVLALMMLIASAIAFDSPPSRRIYLWTLVVNASAISCWGIIQRANQNARLLPGVDLEVAGVPFAGFVYKNAGAAALLPAIAMVAALLMFRKSSRRSMSRYRDGSDPFSIRNLTLMTMAALMLAGLAVTLSRGAWIAAVLAALVVVGTTGLVKYRRANWLVIAGVSVAILALLAVFGVYRDVVAFSDRFSMETVSGDQRWRHWIDGMHTAAAHFPFGSGLGTYGYSTLPHHASTYGCWFQRAHNQYLEILTETGLVGGILLAVAIGWFVQLTRRMIRQRGDNEQRQWTLIATVILVCGAFQSAFDFVLVIPSNLLLYASLIGIIAGLAVEKLPEAKSVSADLAAWRTRLQGSTLVAWCAVGVVCGLWAFQAAGDQLYGERAMKMTALPMENEAPSIDTVNANLLVLDDAIARQPGRAALYRRRADWKFAAYRLSLIEAGSKAGIDVPWLNTEPKHLFNAITLQPLSRQPSIRRDLMSTTEMKVAVADSLADLTLSLHCNPLLPQTRLHCAALGPIGGVADRSLDSLGRAPGQQQPIDAVHQRVDRGQHR